MLKPQFVQIRRQAGLVQVLRDDLRTRRERRLYPGLASSSRFSTAFFASRPAATITDGFDVFVQLVIAAITTEPCVQEVLSFFERRTVRRSSARRRVLDADSGAAAFAFESADLLGRVRSARPAEQNRRALFERLLRVRQQNPVLRALRPGEAGLDRARSSSSVSVYCASGVSAVWNRPCSLQ